MYPVERIALWSAVIILFILYLWPGQSGYIGRKITFMEMREFDKVPEDIQKIYQENALRFADALGDAMSKTWSEVSDDNKKKVAAKYAENVTKVIQTMQTAKQQNGNDMATAFLGVAAPQQMKNPATTETPGTIKKVSTYMPQPSMFFPMMSGFSLDETLNSVKSSIESVPKSSGYSPY